MVRPSLPQSRYERYLTMLPERLFATSPQFSMIVSSWVQASVSVNRLSKFLSSAELQPDAVKVEEVVSLSLGATVRYLSSEFTFEEG